MKDEFKSLKKGEIISIDAYRSGAQLGLPSNGFGSLQLKADELTELITKKLQVTDNQGQNLCTDGIDCEVLKFGTDGWQKGKLKARVVLEFCPDEIPIQDDIVSDI